MLSIVVSCLESETHLQTTLKSIYDANFPPSDFEVLVIRRENVPFTIVTKKFPVREYRGLFNGQAAALNYGIARTKGDIVCFTRPGCLVSHDWLEIIDDFFKLHPSIDGIGGPALPCLEVGTRIQKLASQVFYEGQSFPKSVFVLQMGSFAGLFHATNAAFRKRVLESVAFDESYFYDYDFDACWRMLRKGYRLLFYPKMKIRRVFPASLREILAMYYCWGVESTVLKRQYNLERGLKAYLFPFYNTLRSFLEPELSVSTSALEKRLLRLVQHGIYYTGVMRAYSIRNYTIET
jgi:cellulose synthase/poly-beta-1,6-N-acetylglucosamine synthase-like glycosyltransferase